MNSLFLLNKSEFGNSVFCSFFFFFFNDSRNDIGTKRLHKFLDKGYNSRNGVKTLATRKLHETQFCRKFRASFETWLHGISPLFLPLRPRNNTIQRKSSCYVLFRFKLISFYLLSPFFSLLYFILFTICIIYNKFNANLLTHRYFIVKSTNELKIPAK